MKTNQLFLEQNGPNVIAARIAEEKLFELYGLKAKEHYVTNGATSQTELSN
jgi:hypothetical protein